VSKIKILGIDEAGRGAVLGPLVVGGVLIEDKNEKKLKKIEVKDSKLLKPKQREDLAPKIEEIATHSVVIRISPCKIDSNRRSGGNLNQLEALRMADIINMTKPDKAIIDSPDHNSHKFRDFLWSHLENKNVELVCENSADKNYPVVSAASIVAKVSRDAAIKDLKKQLGEDIGVGYPHDKRTINFLEKIAEQNKGKMPSYVRTTWDTTIQITEKYRQKTILGFIESLIKKKSPCN